MPEVSLLTQVKGGNSPHHAAQYAEDRYCALQLATTQTPKEPKFLEFPHDNHQATTMGLIYTDIVLSNIRKPEIQPITVSALVDTGAVHLCIPEHIAIQLDLDVYEEREVETADGLLHKRPYVGPVLVRFDHRRCLTGAMVLDNEVLLGAIPLEDMDLVVNPARRTVTVNPINPNFAVSKAK